MSLKELNFEKVIEEMKQKFPEVLKILICIMLPKEKRSSEIALAKHSSQAGNDIWYDNAVKVP